MLSIWAMSNGLLNSTAWRNASALSQIRAGFSDVACDELSGSNGIVAHRKQSNAPRARGRELELWSTAEQLLLEMGDTQALCQA